MLSSAGVVVASALLTLTVVLAALAFGTAQDRAGRVDIALLAPVVAALPLFGVFYALGRLIFAQLGQGYGGGLLIAIGALLALGSAVLALRRRKLARS